METPELARSAQFPTTRSELIQLQISPSLGPITFTSIRHLAPEAAPSELRAITAFNLHMVLHQVGAPFLAFGVHHDRP